MKYETITISTIRKLYSQLKEASFLGETGYYGPCPLCHKWLGPKDMLNHIDFHKKDFQ